jgi:hypothetical protein
MRKLSDDNYDMLFKVQAEVKDIFKANTDRINKKTAETVQICQELQNSSKKQSKSYFDRKKIIDWLVYINLGLTPIFLILLYIKK